MVPALPRVKNVMGLTRNRLADAVRFRSDGHGESHGKDRQPTGREQSHIIICIIRITTVWTGVCTAKEFRDGNDDNI